MGKNIVITGAGSGLGRAVARRLAADGDTIILLGRTLSKVEAVANELGEPSFAVKCDVASPNSVRTAFARIAERHATIDVLINNAAVYQPLLVKDATDEQIGTALMTNFAGPIYCSRSAIPMMERGGHIINVSSETVMLPHAMFALYQGSKSGLERFSEALRAELMPDGIRVTVVRAGAMMDENSAWKVDPNVVRRFAEENFKRGIDQRARPVSPFTSVVGLFRTLIDLPAEVNVPQIMLEARYP